MANSHTLRVDAAKRALCALDLWNSWMTDFMDEGCKRCFKLIHAHYIAISLAQMEIAFPQQKLPCLLAELMREFEADALAGVLKPVDGLSLKIAIQLHLNIDVLVPETTPHIQTPRPELKVCCFETFVCLSVKRARICLPLLSCFSTR